MEELLRIKEIEETISIEEFESQIETLNVPVIFRGCVKDWKAFRSWNPNNGGLDYLQEQVQSAIVEVMLSRSAPVFYGDIRSHERVPLPFSSFIEFCKRGRSKDDSHDACSESEILQSVGLDAELCNALTNARDQIYLAQVPILNKENEGRVQLESLQDDIKIPSFLGPNKISSINLWMNNAEARSSTHYDPHHNLLCVVSGCKQVVLWPPSAGSLLYPMPIYGEASNHSSVTLDSPDFSHHPRFERAHEYSQKVTLQAGDSLFIPEGWFHQVDSDKLTIAVNFWWRSNMMSNMLEHMDAYYLRRILRRLIDKEMNQMLQKTYGVGSDKMRGSKAPDNGKTDSQGTQGTIAHQKHENKINLNVNLHDLTPLALAALHELLSLVHDGVSAVSQPCTSTSDSGEIHDRNGKNTMVTESYCLSATTRNQCTSRSDSGVIPDKESKNTAISNLCHLEDDSIASIFQNLEPLDLLTVCMAMVNSFPRTLEALILHMLSPVGAEVLTRKFDELDQLLSEEDRGLFYQRFYSVFDDQFAVMDVILKGKESFALQAFKNVLQLYMGVTLGGTSYTV